ncbi:MAG TPA: hypothetical protein VMU25_01090 [Candidatus Paceibacterota bacterium]|nr:hypothetical protein [Candidatus Paceibacterota bacterium]
MKYFVAVIISIVLTGGIAYADGFAQTLDKPVGNYIANVDYDSFTPEISAGNSTSFSYQLWNKDRSKTVTFHDVSVNIFQKDDPNDTVFSGTLNADFGQAGMRFTFQNAGSYMIDVRFHDSNYATLAEASFPLEIVPNGNTYGPGILWGVLSGLIGVALGIAFMFFRGPSFLKAIFRF